MLLPSQQSQQHHIVKQKSLFLSLMLEPANNLSLFRLSVLRGCMTSGEEWAFFVYKSPTASGDRELFSYSEVISLGSKLERLPLILGLLKDMVCANLAFAFLDDSCITQVANTFNFEQKYFSYLQCY